ncbi:MAG: hypothetical protein LCH61_14000 [Proteobacteria bacterium]|nr:hypothetical protein [Pseudomonadota bacterium]
MTAVTADLSQWATWREIHQQPDVWRKAADDLLPALDDLRRWIAGLDITEVWFCGAGTSAYIGEIVVASLPDRPARRLRAIASTDLVATPRHFLDGSARPLVVSFGRSGNSTESVGTLDLIDRLAPKTPRLNITCNGESVLARRPPQAGGEQRVIVLPDKTHDTGFAMTSSFTTMLLTALMVFSDAPAVRLDGLVTGVADGARVLLPDAVRAVSGLIAPERIVFVGSGPAAAVSREAALKVMELTAGTIPALSESSLGFRHGPKSFVTGNSRIVQFASTALPARLYDADLAAELRRQYGDGAVTVIGPEDSDFPLPHAGLLQPLLQILLPQVAAVAWSHARGLNVDDPFSGTGTLTRVVSHVTLHTNEG